MIIASWNVNSLNVRLPHLLQWLARVKPDILALQETKLVDTKFPFAILQEHGYHAVFAGQPTYNGVAILSREIATDVVTDIPGFADPQRRVIAATVNGVRIINLYVPNGQAVASDKYAYKLSWLQAVTAFIAAEIQTYGDVVVMGDFNIAPDNRDVYDPAAYIEQIHCSTPERAALQLLLDQGLLDSFRLFEQEPHLYSWWDYRAGHFQRNQGLRIDLILLSYSLVGRCQRSTIDVTPRGQPQPSDHAPVIVLLR